MSSTSNPIYRFIVLIDQNNHSTKGITTQTVPEFVAEANRKKDKRSYLLVHKKNNTEFYVKDRLSAPRYRSSIWEPLLTIEGFTDEENATQFLKTTRARNEHRKRRRDQVPDTILNQLYGSVLLKRLREKDSQTTSENDSNGNNNSSNSNSNGTSRSSSKHVDNDIKVPRPYPNCVAETFESLFTPPLCNHDLVISWFGGPEIARPDNCIPTCHRIILASQHYDNATNKLV